MKKRFLVALLAACLVMALLPMTAMANGSTYWTSDASYYDITWYDEAGGTEDEPYLIRDAADLAGLAVLVNGLNATTPTNFDSKYIKLSDDVESIDLSSHYWTPIGTSDGTTPKPFSGTFDGNKKTITGLNTPAGSNYLGLFGYTVEAVITDVTITGCHVGGDENVGGLVGYAENTSITDCQVFGTVEGHFEIGGLVGFASLVAKPTQIEAPSTSITNCSFTGKVVGDPKESHCAGGLVGKNQGNIANSFASAEVSSYALAGGLAADNSGEINGCYATGNVTAHSGHFAGGLVGQNDKKICTSYATGDVIGGNIAGGLVGGNAAISSVITDCYATGKVSAYNEAGGIAGFNDGTIFRCYATGDVASDGDEAGGISGNNGIESKSDNTGKIKKCVALSKCVTGYCAGEITAYNGVGAELSGNVYLEDMVGIGETNDYGTRPISAEEAVDPDIYMRDMAWDVFNSTTNPDGVWYCAPGVYPQLQPISKAPVTILGSGFNVLGGGIPLSSGALVATGTKIELRAAKPGFAVASFVIDYGEGAQTILGDSFILRGAVTVKSVVLKDVSADLSGDIWVCEGYYAIWQSEDLDGSGAIDEKDFELHFLTNDDFLAVAQPIVASSPLTSNGRAVNKNIYLLDGTDLYCGDLNLGTGGIYGLDSVEPTGEDYAYLDLERGTLRAAEIDVPGDLWINKDMTVIVSGDIKAEYVTCCGGILEVGGDIVTDSDVEFNSHFAPLFVTVHGNIEAADDFEHEGGSVTVDGSIKVNDEIECNDREAYYNATELFVGGDLIANYTNGENQDYYDGLVFIGEEDMDYRSLDAAALPSEGTEETEDTHARHLKKAMESGNEELNPLSISEPISECLKPFTLVTVKVGGDLKALNAIFIYGGNVKVAGAIETLSPVDAKTIYIYGGKIEAGSITSATDIYIKESYDVQPKSPQEYYNPLDLHVIGNMTAQDEIAIFSGRVDVEGTIQTLATMSDTIYIEGGIVTAGNIVSASDLYIGGELGMGSLDFGSPGAPMVKVANLLSAAGQLSLYSGMIFAHEISCTGPCVIADTATLFDAVIESNMVDNLNIASVNGEAGPATLADPDPNTLYRTTLSGLIPGALTEITITSDSYSGFYPEGQKTFITLADKNGCVYVWLRGGTMVTGEAIYDGDGRLTGSAASIGEDSAGIVFNPENATLVNIGLNVPDVTFKFYQSPGEEDNNPFDPSNWTFTLAFDGTAVDGFSVDRDDYSFVPFRNGIPYDGEALLAGDYTVYISTTQDITEGDITTTYIATGAAHFTIAPAMIIAQADNKTVSVGAALPEFTITFIDQTGLFEDIGEVDTALQDFFYGQCFGTTAVRGSYPIYARINCFNQNYPEYLFLAKIFDGSFGFIPQNGVLTVRTASNPIGGGSMTVYYDITATAGQGGTITPSGNISVQSGADKTFAIKPDTGYKIADVLVNGKSVGAVDSYTIKNIAQDSTIEAKFVPADAVTMTFSDVLQGAWYYDAVNFVVQRGLCEGTSETTFEPGAPVTRAMFVTILGRLHKVDQAAYSSSSFSDVATGEWYSAYVEWAAKNGIAKGYSDGTFGPDNKITREELCAILSRYCDYAGIKLPQEAAPADFADSGEVQEWARNYVKTVQMAELVQGMENNLFQPQGDADRAQVAMILMRLILNVIEA